MLGVQCEPRTHYIADSPFAERTSMQLLRHKGQSLLLTLAP